MSFVWFWFGFIVGALFVVGLCVLLDFILYRNYYYVPVDGERDRGQQVGEE